MRPGARDLLLMMDVQRDFCAGGALAVPDGDAVVPVVNALAARFAAIVLTQDWHPAGGRFLLRLRRSRPPDPDGAGRRAAHARG
jgi:nicotinamidase-related amidase